MRAHLLAGLALAALPAGACATGKVAEYNIGAQTPQQLSPGMTRRYISTDKATMAIYDLRKGTRVATHYHDSEQLTYVQSGRLRIVIDDKSYNIGQGEVIVIPQYAKHSVEALETTVEIDYFTPKRFKWTDDSDENGPLPRKE